ncbi:hypothetical protein TNCV_2272311 [Trichonephila clavipes]|nr:hypothetical protein TNCV_2272311 [Trichonephila clavipes]
MLTIPPRILMTETRADQKRPGLTLINHLVSPLTSGREILHAQPVTSLPLTNQELTPGLHSTNRRLRHPWTDLFPNFNFL